MYEDILDRIGKTPRELGALQIYVEAVHRTERGTGQTTVWVQAAFEPLPKKMGLRIVADNAAGEHVQLAKLEFPPIKNDGTVLRWPIRFKLAEPVAQVMFEVSAVRPGSSSRVREAWLLTDTYQAP